MFCCLVNDDPARDVSSVLEEIARACSPRVQVGASGAAVFDASGLDRAIGTPAEIGSAVQQLAAARGVVVRVALARTSVAAWLLAHARPDVTVAAGDPRAALASLPLGWLAALPDTGPRPQAPGGSPPHTGRRPLAGRPRSARHYRVAPGPAREESAAVVRRQDDLRRADRDAAAVLERWGIRTLGDLARLPRGDVHARLGPAGVRLHQAACGEDAAPLVPEVEAARFVERLQLEWPIEGLEPLSFVLARLCDALSRSLERADRGAVTVKTTLVLVSRETHARTLHLPAPMRDARVLRTLILLDLESHPPPAGIDAVEIALDVVAGRIVQGSLLARALPSPEDLATLTARLQALAGETRVGAPAVVDSHDERRFTMRPFAPGAAPGPQASDSGSSGAGADGREPAAALRRYRRPIPARVRLERGLPTHVQPSSRLVPAGAVVGRAGPWRGSGDWWSPDAQWDREGWDVEIAGGGCYRLARVRATGHWEVEAEID